MIESKEFALPRLKNTKNIDECKPEVQVDAVYLTPAPKKIIMNKEETKSMSTKTFHR